MNALSFNKRAAQGELTITTLDHHPKIVGSRVASVNGVLIVGHSETGHHHVIDADCATMTRIDPFTALVNVTKATTLRHLRETDTHQPLALQPGMYEFRTGREFDPFKELIRASQD